MECRKQGRKCLMTTLFHLGGSSRGSFVLIRIVRVTLVLCLIITMSVGHHWPVLPLQSHGRAEFIFQPAKRRGNEDGPCNSVFDGPKDGAQRTTLPGKSLNSLLPKLSFSSRRASSGGALHL